jgi:hypothetical protein
VVNGQGSGRDLGRRREVEERGGVEEESTVGKVRSVARVGYGTMGLGCLVCSVTKISSRASLTQILVARGQICRPSHPSATFAPGIPSHPFNSF